MGKIGLILRAEFWVFSWVLGIFLGFAFFWIPAFGPLLVAGQLVSATVGALEGAAVLGGLTALGAGLYSLRVPKNSVIDYETAIKSGHFVLVVYGGANEIESARQILKDSNVVGEVESFITK